MEVSARFPSRGSSPGPLRLETRQGGLGAGGHRSPPSLSLKLAQEALKPVEASTPAATKSASAQTLDAAPRPALRRRARRRVGLHGARGGPCAAARARAAAARPAGARDLGARRRRRRRAPDRRVPGPGRAPGHRAAVLREPRPLRLARVPGSRHGHFGALLREVFPRPPPGHRRLRPLEAGAGARGVRRRRRPADGRGVPRRREGVAADDLPGRGPPLARGGQVDVGVPRGEARRRVFFCRRGAAQPLRLRRGRGALASPRTNRSSRGPRSAA